MNRLKSHLRRTFGPFLQTFGYSSGIMQLAASLQHIDGAIILMYHSVADDINSEWIDPNVHLTPGVFEQQMTFLAKNKKVVSLSSIVKDIRKGKTPKDGTVAITFDDGYLDNITIAAPILNRLGLVATLFLPTGNIDSGEAQWVDQAYCAFKYSTKPKLFWGKKNNTEYDLNVPTQYSDGYHNVCASLLNASITDRRMLLLELKKQLKPSRNSSHLTMNWNDVITLLERYQCFEIGGHTINHIDLQNASKEESQKEIIGCSKRILEVTGVQPQFFSFPYGRSSESLRYLVQEAGFQAACGSGGYDSVVNTSKDLYNLPRIEAPNSIKRFEMQTHTANIGFWRKIGRLT